MTAPFADLGALRAHVATDEGLAALLRLAEDGGRGDPAHDGSHVLRVALWTTRLAPPEVPRREAIAAALLHDVVNLPKDSPRRADASALAAEVALRELPRLGFDPPAVRRVADAVRTHSFSRGETPVTPLGDALQDADRLEALGALGLFRCVATGVRMNARFFDDEDPWAERRPLDERAFSVDHLFAKLLKLPATMRTEAGRSEALRRADTLVSIARALGEELGVPPPECAFPPR